MPPTFTRGRCQIRTLQLIRPSRIPSRRRLANIMSGASLVRVASRINHREANDRNGWKAATTKSPWLGSQPGRCYCCHVLFYGKEILMNWLWKRGDSGPDKALGPDGEDAVWFHHLVATLKDHKRVSAPTLTELVLAETPNENELPSAKTPTDTELASTEMLHEDELAFADTLTDREVASSEMLQDNKLASAETLNDYERVSAPALIEHKRASIRNWGMAAAVASSLGLVLLYSRPAWDGKTSAGERLPRVAAHAGQASGAGQGLDHYSAQAPGNLNGAAASGPEEQAAPPGETPAASGTLSRPFELQRASDKETAQDVGERATRDTLDAHSHVDTTSTGTTPAAAGASSVPMEAADARPRVPVPTSPVAHAPVIARAPPRARIAPAIIGVPVGVGSSRSLISSPPQWIGGGPTDADNREGRYQGTVAVQIAIDPDGHVSNCAPVRGSGNAGLDAMTCRLVKERARFTPALDARGRPVVSQAYRTIVWSRRRVK